MFRQTRQIQLSHVVRSDPYHRSRSGMPTQPTSQHASWILSPSGQLCPANLIPVRGRSGKPQKMSRKLHFPQSYPHPGPLSSAGPSALQESPSKAAHTRTPHGPEKGLVLNLGQAPPPVNQGHPIRKGHGPRFKPGRDLKSGDVGMISFDGNETESYPPPGVILFF